MFGRIRASTSSLDTLEGSPSKILKDDTFSIYEATLMKLKLGARRDVSGCSVSAPCTEERNLKAHLNSASTSCSEITMMDTHSDGSSSARVSNSEQRRQSNISILHFYKVEDTGRAGMSTSGETTASARNGSSDSISSTSAESHYRNEVEGVQIMQDCEMSD